MGDTVQPSDGSVPCWLQLWVLWGCSRVWGRARGWLCILPLDSDHQKEESQATKALRVGVRSAEISGLPVYKCQAHLDSFPSTSLNCFEQCFFQSGFLAVPIMTGQDPKERRTCEGPAVTFRWLPWVINLLEKGSSRQLQRAVCLQQQHADPQSCPFWL